MNWLVKLIESKVPIVWGDNIQINFVKRLPKTGEVGIIYVIDDERFIWDEYLEEFNKIVSLKWYNSRRNLELQVQYNRTRKLEWGVFKWNLKLHWSMAEHLYTRIKR